MGFLIDLIVAYWWLVVLAVVALVFGLRFKRGRG